jgi:hypothetical protein
MVFWHEGVDVEIDGTEHVEEKLSGFLMNELNSVLFPTLGIPTRPSFTWLLCAPIGGSLLEIPTVDESEETTRDSSTVKVIVDILKVTQFTVRT